MSRRNIRFRLAVALIAVAASSAATLSALSADTPPAFKSPPTVSRTAAGAAVSFEVDRPTDVAVWVVDAGGKAVRHLAAGMLGGPQPPPEPLKPGLAQTLVWDGKDDYGASVPAGALRGGGSFRVALGLRPEFAGFLNWHPDALRGTYRAAVAPGGNLYYFYWDPANNGNQGDYKVKIRSRNGRHVRTLVPFPADLKPGEEKPFESFRDDDGFLVPKVHNYQAFTVYPTVQGTRRKEVQCYSPAVDSRGRLYWTVTGNRLIGVDADGRCPYPTYISEPLLPGNCNLYLACGGDDKHLYLSGAVGADKEKTPRHCVYRVDAATRKPAEPFLGKPDQPGRGTQGLNAPRGVAVAGGMLYVADYGNNRVAAFKESDGAYAGEVKIPKPCQVCVDGRTGAIYLISEPKPLFSKLHKFDGLKSQAPSKTMDFPKDWAKYGRWTMALDASSEPARLYFPPGYVHREAYNDKPFTSKLTCFEDTSAGFKQVAVPEPEGRYAFNHKDLYIDRRRDELYIKSDLSGRWDRFDAETGEYKDSVTLPGTGGNSGGEIAVDSQGRLAAYRWVHNAGAPALVLFERNGKPIPIEGPGWSGIMTFMQKFMDLYNDEIYLVADPGNYMGRGRGNQVHCVNVYGMDFKPKRTVIWQCSDGAMVKVGPRGNIFLAENVRPLDRSWPKFFDGKLPPVNDTWGARGAPGTWWYSYMYGSIVKFSPKGGAVWFKEGLIGGAAEGKPGPELDAMAKQPFRFTGHWKTSNRGTLQGAEWVRFGFAPYSSCYGIGTGACQCEGVGFDVDAFGRVFYPNLGRFRIEVVDNNNNFIGTFGHYGNADSRLVPTDATDGKPLVAVPDIPLAWPTYVAAADNYAYVGDVVNMRTVKVKLAYETEAAASIP